MSDLFDDRPDALQTRLIGDAEWVLQTLVDLAPVLTWMAGPDGQRTYFNERWLQFTGRSLAQERGEGWAEGVHLDDRSQVLATYRAGVAHVESWEMEFRLRRADGAYRWMLARGLPMMDGETFAGFIGSCTDITDWRQAEERVEAERALLDAIVEQLPAGVIVVDAAGMLVRGNRVADQLLGPPVAGRVDGEERLAYRLSHADGRHYRNADLPASQAIASGDPVPPAEYDMLRPDGTPGTVIASATPVRDANGKAISAATVLFDVTDQKAAERERAALYDRLSRLQSITAALSEARTPAQVVDVVLGEVVGAVRARAGTVALLDATGLGMEVVGAVGLMSQIVTRFQRFKLDDPLPLAQAARIRRVVTHASREELLAASPQLAEPVRLSGNQAWAAIPLVASDRLLGVIGMSFASPRRFDQDEQAFLRSIGEQCAQALDRANLYAAETAARAEAMAANERLAFLAKASAVLNASLDLDTTLTRLAQLAVPRLADCCVVTLLDEQGQPQRVATKHADPEREALIAELGERYPVRLTAPAGTGAVLRTGHRQFYPEITDELLQAMAVDAEHLASIRHLEIGSGVAVPLSARGHILGALVLANQVGRQAKEADLALAEELAARAATAVDHARLFADRSHIARSLQASLLPPTLPTPPGLQFGAEYIAAGAGVDVGGDFYDVFAIGQGATGRDAWLLVVGDVCGKGVEAAAVTGLARHTIRAVALGSSAPSEILGQVNEVLLRADAERDAAAPDTLSIPRFCTACVVEVVPHDGGARLTACSGGHPLPLVLRADGVVEEVGEPGSLVGVLPIPELTDATAELGPGDALICYTDGITERHQGGRFFEDHIVAVLAAAAGLDAPALAQRVRDHAQAFVDLEPVDDMAVVVVRVPSREDVETAHDVVLPARPSSPGRARRFIVEALARAGCGARCETAELLTSELVTNAVVHAGTGVRLRTSCVNDLVRVEVTDLSTVLPARQQPPPEATSGRGLVLVDSLADRWGFEPSPSGKTVWFELDR